MLPTRGIIGRDFSDTVRAEEAVGIDQVRVPTPARKTKVNVTLMPRPICRP